VGFCRKLAYRIQAGSWRKAHPVTRTAKTGKVRPTLSSSISVGHPVLAVHNSARSSFSCLPFVATTESFETVA
jgi:hypothetical protein